MVNSISSILRQSSQALAQIDEESPGNLEKPYVRFLAKIRPDDCKIYIVDGNYVRNKINIEFNLGGHGIVYDTIPKDEIWIEQLPNSFDMEENLAHEIVERIFMKWGHVKYDPAHEIASSIEHAIRIVGTLTKT